MPLTLSTLMIDRLTALSLAVRDYVPRSADLLLIECSPPIVTLDLSAFRAAFPGRAVRVERPASAVDYVRLSTSVTVQPDGAEPVTVIFRATADLSFVVGPLKIPKTVTLTAEPPAQLPLPAEPDGNRDPGFDPDALKESFERARNR